ncbi:MAG TPA: sigma-54 dependent transcriptional regulator [bacterium]|nr:sigma-54 dependent transcriptional regulator [bacterium]
MIPTILIVDDEQNTREGLKSALEHDDYAIRLAASAEEALSVLQEEQVDLMITDLLMPGKSGIELMDEARKISPETLCIMITAYGTVETAVEAMKAGAYDYLTKPINIDRVEILVKRALASKRLANENVNLKKMLEKKYAREGIVGNSGEMTRIYELIGQVANSRATVLIQGESGTGKELIAKAIHMAGEKRDRPFIAVHCASLAEGLLESELFGHEKGAFTGAIERKIGRFELADGGTLFLDEVSEMSPSTQVKLLRVIQERQFERVGGTKTLKVDVRIITATNKDLMAEVKAGKFREDLYYRINVVHIMVPPLRSRSGDIPLLVNHFLKMYGMENKKIVEGVTPEAMKVFSGYSWPGNVRELQNCLETMVVLARNKVLDVKDIPANVMNAIESVPAPLSGQVPINLSDAEKELIKKALAETKNNKTRAAELLGLSRRTLHRKINEYGL